MKFVSYKDPNFKYSGVWQDNTDGEIVSYGTVSFAEIGFTGTQIEVVGYTKQEVHFFIDGIETNAEKTQNGYKFNLPDGKHTLKLRARFCVHFHLSGINVCDDSELFVTPNKPYVHYIGDSITYACPGYAEGSALNLGVDFSIVAQCGMSLVDGWGWYGPHPEAPFRRGMESTYFGLEFGDESATLTPYKFEYLRTPDIIVIFLGTNDYLNSPQEKADGNIDTFAQRYLTFVKKLRALYPKAPILMLQGLSDMYCRVEAINVAYDLINSQVENVTLIPSNEWGVKISDDGTHPAPEGYAHMCDCMAKVLDEQIKKLNI